jgi:UDP-N-acetylglucosamine--N-acetylmuramyl-(pentapeptide) pyrophosphoryl-undecaprenol N-acetylglucosamine transferase
MPKHRIVLSGGGTGGHIYPALAVAEALQEDPNVEEILYIGVTGHLEEKLANERKINFVGIKTSGLPRKLSLNALAWPFELWQACARVQKEYERFAPTAVLGTGGYATAPPLIAALIQGIPYAIHEPDAHPGMVNKLLAKFASLISVGMEAGLDKLKTGSGKVAVNGNPVGKNFVRLLKRDSSCAVLGLKEDLKTVIVTGGSQGAQAINETMLQILPSLLEAEPKIQIIHQVGNNNILEFKERLPAEVRNNPRYCLRAYFDDLALPYAASDLAVCRSGAMTIAELSVTGKPAIFIPYPYASGDHQNHNAQFMQSRGAAIVLPQQRLTPQSLRDLILSLFGDHNHLDEMAKAMRALGKPQAAVDLANQVKEISTLYQIRQRKERQEIG